MGHASTAARGPIAAIVKRGGNMDAVVKMRSVPQGIHAQQHDGWCGRNILVIYYFPGSRACALWRPSRQTKMLPGCPVSEAERRFIGRCRCRLRREE